VGRSCIDSTALFSVKTSQLCGLPMTDVNTHQIARMSRSQCPSRADLPVRIPVLLDERLRRVGYKPFLLANGISGAAFAVREGRKLVKTVWMSDGLTSFELVDSNEETCDWYDV
jgi:hypothetical protein